MAGGRQRQVGYLFSRPSPSTSPPLSVPLSFPLVLKKSQMSDLCPSVLALQADQSTRGARGRGSKQHLDTNTPPPPPLTSADLFGASSFLVVRSCTHVLSCFTRLLLCVREVVEDKLRSGLSRAQRLHERLLATPTSRTVGRGVNMCLCLVSVSERRVSQVIAAPLY